jgi:RNA polymerase sigma factor for flagellar operon FliA
MSTTQLDPSAAPVEELWAQYRATGDAALRNELLERYLPLVRGVAGRVHQKLPEQVELDDLVSAGTFGLMVALDAFDPARGVKFETYAGPRVRGAILDELRSMDWVPRLVRHRSNRVERAADALQAESGRAPTEEELADRLGMSAARFAQMHRDAEAVGMYSLSRPKYETDSAKQVLELDALEDGREPHPVAQAQKRDLKHFISRGLTRSERLILVLYYYEHMTMKEIGQALEFCESRVSQMHSSILARLKARMQRVREELEPQEG